MSKRCMTKLDDEALAEVQRLAGVEARSESQMIAILVKEAVAVRRASAGENRRG